MNKDLKTRKLGLKDLTSLKCKVKHHTGAKTRKKRHKIILQLLKKTKKKTKNTSSYMDLPTLHIKKR